MPCRKFRPLSVSFATVAILRQLEVSPVQGLDLLAGVVEVRIIVYYVIGYRETLLAARLRRQYSSGLFFAFDVTSDQSVNLGRLVAVDDQNSIDKLPERRLSQKGNDYDLVCALRCTSLSDCFLLNDRVKNILEPAPHLLVREHKSSHRRSIQSATRIDHIGRKLLSNSFEARFTGLNYRARDHVGVDNCCAEIGEHVGDRCLAACDTAGEPDAQRRTSLFLLSSGSHSEHQVEIRVLDRLAVQQRYPACGSEVRAKRYGYASLMSSKYNQRDANNRTNDCRHHDDHGQGLPTQPRAQCRE